MDDSVLVGFRHRRIWLIAVLLLLFGQAYLTLRLFGPDRPWDQLLDDAPITTGAHPLHLYHGWLGATSWRETGCSSCYDPSFQAGYPKTPVFDSGCRFSEVAHYCRGTPFCPAAYKIGFAIGCLWPPLLMVVAGRGIGLSPAACCFMGLLGSGLWWTEPIRSRVLHGDGQMQLASLFAAVHLAWLTRFARWPGLDSWVTLTLSGAAVWFLHPVVGLALVPLVVAYYCWAGWRQEFIWHLAWFGSGVIALLPNACRLWDWLRFAWMRGSEESVDSGEALLLPTWQNMEWPYGWIFDYPVLAGVIGLGIVGLLGLWFTRRRAAAGLLGLGILVPIGVAIWLHQQGDTTSIAPERILPFAAWFAVGPAVMLLTLVMPGRRFAGIAFLTLTAAGVGWVSHHREATFRIGFTNGQLATLERLRESTHSGARILWEETEADLDRGWTALLPVLTERFYLGGLDPDAKLDYMFARLADGHLTDHPISDWTDSELRRFFNRYNIGWVVARSAETQQRLASFPDAALLADLPLDPSAMLFQIADPPGFVLRGEAAEFHADSERVTLRQAIPSSDGDMLLSLHYVEGMRVSPAYVQLEREIDPFDPIPFVRLKLPGPVPRLALTWDGR